jgi:hypothetical protein
MAVKIRLDHVGTMDDGFIGDVIAWLVEHVGPLDTRHAGTIINGEGWQIIPTFIHNHVQFFVEVNDHVDDETALMFTLKFSS